jgi:hypothetical protein
MRQSPSSQNSEKKSAFEIVQNAVLNALSFIKKYPWQLLLATLLILWIGYALAPSERTLGDRLGLVIIHGAMVWTGLLAFGTAALAGLVGLISRRTGWFVLSQAAGRTGLIFWWLYLPMSLLVMWINWGGLFFDEPRWRIPFMFGVVGLLLQAGLSVLDRPFFTAFANLVFGAALAWQLFFAENVLHPSAPVANSGSWSIQAHFSYTFFITLLLGIQITIYWVARSSFFRKPN